MPDKIWVGGVGFKLVVTNFFVFRIVNSVAFHPDGNCIAAGTADHYVKVRRRWGGGGGGGGGDEELVHLL